MPAKSLLPVPQQLGMTNPPRGRWRRRLGWAAAILVGLWAISAAWLLGTAWYSVPGYAPSDAGAGADFIMSNAAYGEVISTHARPYIFELETEGGGGVLFFGAEHTDQPDDPQLATIRERWAVFRPTVALIEGDLGMMFPAFMDPVQTFGETGFVHALARANGVPTYSWEPPDELIIQGALDQGFTAEQVALRWVLNSYFSNLRFGRPADPEAFVRDTLAERAAAEGISGALTDMASVDAAWTRSFPDGPDWREVSDEYGLPGFLGEMDLNRPRDIHLVACCVELARAGERVFVVGGLSHAVKVEPALLEALGR